MSTKSLDHRITFPLELYDYVKVRVQQTGMSIPEYVRFLVLTDVKPLMEKETFVDEITEKSIDRAIENVKKGETVKVVNEKELAKLLASL